MRILVVYASSEGQTRRVARHVLARLAAAGHAVEMLAAAEAEGTDPAGCDAAVLAGSVHSNALQPALSAFAGAAAGALERLPTLLLVVSLSAAGSEADDWRGLDRVVAEFTAATGWTPGRVEHVAGAFRFSRYGPVERFVMRRIAHARDPGLDTASDHEYTDWPRLDAALARWLESLSG